MSDLLYWHESWSTAKSLDEAVEYMRDSIEADDDSPQYAAEVRPAEFDDVPDFFDAVVDFLDERIYDNEALGHDDGGPTLAPDKVSEQAEGLRSAITEYLRRNVLMDNCACQNTGRTLRVTSYGFDVMDTEVLSG